MIDDEPLGPLKVSIIALCALIAMLDGFDTQRLAMKRERIKELPIYPEQRFCKRPTTEQILRLFSLAERHTLLRDAKPIQSFPPQLTELQRQTLDLLGVPERAFLA